MSFMIFQNLKSPFQAIKTKTSKSRKIDTFPKGLTHGFRLKMVIFRTFFFQAIQARKMSFTIFQNEKKPFQAIKTRSSKSRKIDIFPKGLTHGFGPKMGIFPIFLLVNIGKKYLLRYCRFFQLIFLGNKGQENVFCDILKRRNAFLGYKKKNIKKLNNSHFFKGVNPWFLSKNGHFSTFFFLGNKGQENVFYDILERKIAFLGYKNKKFKKSKN